MEIWFLFVSVKYLNIRRIVYSLIFKLIRNLKFAAIQWRQRASISLHLLTARCRQLLHTIFSSHFPSTGSVTWLLCALYSRRINLNHSNTDFELEVKRNPVKSSNLSINYNFIHYCPQMRILRNSGNHWKCVILVNNGILFVMFTGLLVFVENNRSWLYLVIHGRNLITFKLWWAFNSIPFQSITTTERAKNFRSERW